MSVASVMVPPEQEVHFAAQNAFIQQDYILFRNICPKNGVIMPFVDENLVGAAVIKWVN